MTILGPQIRMLGKKVGDLGFDRPDKQGTGPVAQDFRELVVEGSWLKSVGQRYRWARHIVPSAEK